MNNAGIFNDALVQLLYYDAWLSGKLCCKKEDEVISLIDDDLFSFTMWPLSLLMLLLWCLSGMLDSHSSMFYNTLNIYCAICKFGGKAVHNLMEKWKVLVLI